MQERPEDQKPEVLAAHSKDLIPLSGIGNNPVLRMMDLTSHFPQQLRELNDVMASIRETSGPASIDLTIFPDAENPIVEQRVNPMGGMHLKVNLEPTSKKVKIRVGWQRSDSDDFQSEGFMGDKRATGYWFRLEDLKKFAGEVYPDKNIIVEGKSLTFAKHSVSDQWNLSDVEVSHFEEFFWRCASDNILSTYSEEVRMQMPWIVSHAEWTAQAEETRKPLFVFELIRPHTLQGLQTFLAVPHIFWEGKSEETERVMDSFRRLIDNCWTYEKNAE